MTIFILLQVCLTSFGKFFISAIAFLFLLIKLVNLTLNLKRLDAKRYRVLKLI
jgi:hypothetical protein